MTEDLGITTKTHMYYTEQPVIQKMFRGMIFSTKKTGVTADELLS